MKPKIENQRKPMRAPLTAAQRADTLRSYIADVGSHELLSPDEELKLARDIEETELACWHALLGNPSTVDYVVEQISKLLGKDSPETETLVTAVRATGRDRSKKVRAAMNRELQHIGEQLRGVSAHWDVLETVIAHMRTLRDDPASAPAVRFQPDGKAYRAWLSRVGATQRAAARTRNRFVNANLRLVFHTARRYLGSGIPLADLVQEGNLGLIRAIDKFDHRRGLRFSTYAGWWLRHMIGRAVANRSRAVRVPVYLLELRGRLDRIAAELERDLGRPPTDAEVAAVAEIPEEKVQETRTHCQWYELSLDDTVGREDGEGSSRHETFSDPENEERSAFDMVAAAGDRSTVAELLASLPARERDVIEKRFGFHESGREWTLREIAEQHHLSRERIRQIEKKAMTMMRETLDSRDHAA